MTKNRLLVPRGAKLAAVAALATLTLAGCGSDPAATTSGGGASAQPSASGSGSGSALACPSGKLSAEGSTAQNNAITEVIANYNGECSDKATI